MAPKPTAQEAITAYGLEAVCEAITEGESLTGLAKIIGVSVGSLLTWIEADPERSARVRDTRAAMARVWDERAEEGLRTAEDDLGLRRAKELAHHYRWRAAKVAPRDYGDAVTLRGDKDNPVEVRRSERDLTDAELAALARAGLPDAE